MATGQDDSFINLQAVESSSSNNTELSMTKHEESAIIQAVEGTEGFFDILSAVDKMKNKLHLDSCYTHLLRSVTVVNMSTREKLLCFIFRLVELLSFTRLTSILHSVGFDILAVKITANTHGVALGEIGPAKLTSSAHLQRYFYTLKRLLDDNAFKCRKIHLQTLFNKLTTDLEHSENCDTQTNVGKLATVAWLRVQQCERSHDIKEIITAMLNKIPQSVDKTLPDIVFKSKLAVAYELDGDSDASDEHLSQAVSLSESYAHPLIKSLLFHDKRYVHQLRFMRLRDYASCAMVQTDCLEAIHFFSAFQTDFCRFMWRIFCLYFVHNLLKIGQNFEIDISEVASFEERAQASVILMSLERCFQSGPPLEQRRKMIYFVLRARTHEFGGDNDIAVLYLSEADSVRYDGTFFAVEEAHLLHFKQRLEDMERNKQL